MASDLADTSANPIRAIREGMGLSIRKAAIKIGCHHQTLFMNEKGMFGRVLPVIMMWLTDNSDYSEQDINDSYRGWIAYRRRQAVDKYQFYTVTVAAIGIPGENPVTMFRGHLGLTQSAFCKELCVPIAIMYNAEGHRSNSLPRTIKRLLTELGVPRQVVQEMIDRYEDL